MPANGSPSAAQQQPSQFRNYTREQRFALPAATANAFGQLISVQLPQTAWLASITLAMQATITTGAGTATGNFATYPPLPYALIQRIRVVTTEGIQLFNLSGWALQMYLMRRKRSQFQFADLTTYLNANGRALLYTTNSGAAVAATAYTFNAIFDIPIFTDDAMMLGLMLLQTADIRLNVEITTCQASDLGNIGGVTVTPAFTFTVSSQTFSNPDSSMDQPNRQFVKQVTEDKYPFNNTGDIIYPLKTGNIYLSVNGIVESSGAQVAPANINTAAFRFAASTYVYNDSYAVNLATFKRNFGFTPPDGWISFEFDLGSGVPGLLDTRDWFNSSQQSDVAAIVNVGSGFTPTAAQIRWVKEELAVIG